MVVGVPRVLVVGVPRVLVPGVPAAAEPCHRQWARAPGARVLSRAQEASAAAGLLMGLAWVPSIASRLSIG